MLLIMLCFLALLANTEAQEGECTLDSLFNNTGQNGLQQLTAVAVLQGAGHIVGGLSTITVIRSHTLCLAPGSTPSRYRSISVLLEYTCAGGLVCPYWPNPPINGIAQFDFGCKKGFYDPSRTWWSYKQFGMRNSSQTLNPIANFSTSLRTDCNVCFSVAPPGAPMDSAVIDPVTHCQEKGCANLGNDVENGDVEYSQRIVMSNRRYSEGTTATVICSEGYRGGGDITCLSSGIWSSPSLPRCRTPDDCGDLGNPPSGMVSYSTTTYNSTATYSCNSDFFLTGNDKRTCLQSGVWSGSEPLCILVDCLHLSNPANGIVLFSSTNYNATASYSCNVGYTLTGDNVRICQSSAYWSGSEPTCNVVDCGTLDNPGNGIVSVSSTTYNAVATYFCNTGYTLMGSNMRTCQNSGIWSGRTPTCVVDCGFLGNPGNGNVSLSSTTYNSTATYSCKTGYTLTGDDVRICLDSGIWSGNEPTCTDMCVFNNMTYVEGDSFPSGDNCNYCTCSGGTTICSADHCPEPCDGDEFRCPNNEFGPCFPNTYLCDSHTDCDNGFDEQNCSTIEVSTSLVMSIEEGVVDSFQFCLIVTEARESHIFRKYIIDSIQESAMEGLDYIFYNNNNNTVTFNGSYSVGDSECATVNISAQDDSLVEGTEVFNVLIHPFTMLTSIFIIDNDYMRIGFEETSYSVVESVGVLEISVRLLADKNAITRGIALPLGVRVTSKDGSAVAGGDYQRVLTTIHFRPDHSPVLVVHINILDDKLQEGEERFTVELTVFDLSIVLVNSITEVLIQDDEDVLTCSKLQHPADGSVQYSSVTIGSYARYTCNDGFLLEGVTTTVCQIDGTWSEEVPTCQRVVASEVCTVELVGSIEVNGNTATYAFRGVGSDISRFICKLNGQFLPNCGSPLTGLPSGLHRLRLVPVGCNDNQGRTFRFVV